MRTFCITLFALVLISSCDQNGTDDSDNFDKESNYSATTIRNYGDARSVLWNDIYGGGGNSLYCNTPFKYREKGFNIEHVMPMSWVKNELNCKTRKTCRKRDDFNRIEADLHNLFVAESKINSDRSSIPFGEIKGENWSYKGCDYENNNLVVEPRPEVRGDIARAMFYMSTRYNIPIFPRQLAILKEWHREDPASEEEKKRNQRIASIQGNTNGFIDDANYINEAF